MALLSRKVDYALLILWHLYRIQDGASARVIAEQFQLSRPFVANILKQLCNAGFVSSERGIKGGYSLAKSADSIRLTSLMEALDDPFFLAECCEESQTESSEVTVPDLLSPTQHHETETTRKRCELESCPIRSPIQQIHTILLGVLQNITLAQLANGRSGGVVALDTSRCDQNTTSSVVRQVTDPHSCNLEEHS